MVDELKEVKVLQALADGMEIGEICRSLGISNGQYYYFMALLKAKHNAKNAAHLVSTGMRKKIIS